MAMALAFNPALSTSISSSHIQAYADSLKTSDLKKDIKQHTDQDNLCHRSDYCRQANEDQQIEGKDNTATGLNDQSQSTVQKQLAKPHLSVPAGNGTTPTPISPTGALIVNKHVSCIPTTVFCPAGDKFHTTASTNNGSSISFNGSESGTSLMINPPFPVSYHISESNPPLGSFITNIPVGYTPFGIAFNPDNGFLYVANFESSNVSVIDPATNTVVATIPVGTNPLGVAFNPDNGFMYVANQDSNTVSVIAPLTTTFSEGCNGTIGNAGQTATCTVTNAYGRPA